MYEYLEYFLQVDFLINKKNPKFLLNYFIFQVNSLNI